MRWSKEDLDLLESSFQHKTNEEIAKLMGVCPKRVAKKISRLGWKRNYIHKYPDLPEELWKDFPDDATYEVSNLGRIRRKDNNYIIKPWYSSSDYYYVELGGKQYLAHRVVAITWIKNEKPGIKTEVNHINGDKADFSPSSLEWVTPSENMIHSFATGLNVGMFGVENPSSKLSTEQVKFIRSNLSMSSRCLAKKFSVDKGTILNIRNNKTYLSDTYFP